MWQHIYRWGKRLYKNNYLGRGDTLITQKEVNKIAKKVEKVLNIKFSKIELTEMQFSDVDTIKKIVRLGVPALEYDAKHNKTTMEKTVFKVLMHEALHLKGFHHDKDGNKIGFYSSNGKDKFTKAIIKLLVEK